MPLRRVARLLTLLLGGAALAAAPAQLKAPRVAAHPDEGYTRVVLDAPGAPPYSLDLTGKRQVALTVRGVKAQAASGSPGTGELASWKLSSTGSDAVLTLGTTFDLTVGKGYRAFRLAAADGAPDRVVVDLGPKPAAAASAASTPPRGDAKATPIAALASHAPKRAAPVVVIDAGHGGKFKGAYSAATGVREEQVTLDTALRVQALLSKNGVKVVMTRTEDEHLAEDIRSDLQARANKASTDKALFVSIHVNSSPTATTTASGVEAYYFGETMDSQTLAQAERENGGGEIGKELTRYALSVRRDILREMSASTNLQYSQRAASKVLYSLLARTGAANRGIKQASFLVIAKARIPAILVEIGFANNPTEGRKLNTGEYRQQVADGIADGVLKFLGLDQ